MIANRPHWSPRTKMTVSMALLALCVFLLYRIRAVLAPFTLAVILAYVLAPLVNRLQVRFKLHRGWAVILSYAIVLVIIAGFVGVLLPMLADQFFDLNIDIQHFWQQLRTLLGHRYYIAGQVIDLDTLFQQAGGSLQAMLQPVFNRTLGFAVEVVTSIVWLIFIFVVSFYLMREEANLRKWFEGLAPPAYRTDYIRLRDEINRIWTSFFRGQLNLALVVAIIFSIAGMILGLPFALAMGVLAGILEFLPSLGHGIWLITASLLALLVGSTWIPIPNWVFLLIIIGLHIFFQQFDLNYLIPRIIGRSVHLSPLVVILGIVTGALLAGVLGILLAAPAIASLRVLTRYLYANLFDLDPFPDNTQEPSLPPPDLGWWRKKVPGKAREF